MNTLVAKWRFTATSPKLGDRLFSAFSSPGRVVYRNVAFLLGAPPYVQLLNRIRMVIIQVLSFKQEERWEIVKLWPAIKKDQDGHYSSSELETGRKVRNFQILTIFDHLSILMHLSITWPSCDVSGRIDFIFCLLVGRWHLHSMI